MNNVRSLTLVVLAAGIGSRFGRKKQLEPVGPAGEAILDYSIYDALSFGFARIVFVVNEGMEAQFRERFSPITDRCDTRYVIQRLDEIPAGFTVPPGRRKPWGTAHALLVCRREIDGPFGLINADDFYGRRAFASLARSLAAEGKEGVLIGYRIERTLSQSGPVSRGICRVDEAGYLVEIVERKRVERREGSVGYEEGGRWRKIPEGTIASMNLWGLPLPFLEEVERMFPAFLRRSDPLTAEYGLPAVIGEGIRDGRLRVRVVRTGEEWFGLTYPDDLPRARARIARLIEEGAYPSPLFE